MNDHPHRLVLASANAGKIAELTSLLTPLGYAVEPLSRYRTDDVEETGKSFVENALLKARAACEASGWPSVADDSGLEVDALNGAPGLYSSRYASLHDAGAGDADNNALLLEQLKSVPGERRSARFRCVIVGLRHPDDPSPLIAEGSWEGIILHAPDGDHGFGYDPLFRNLDTGESAARLSAADKNRLSHRGKAVQILLQRLREQPLYRSTAAAATQQR